MIALELARKPGASCWTCCSRRCWLIYGAGLGRLFPSVVVNDDLPGETSPLAA
jgi:hypothetical protein